MPEVRAELLDSCSPRELTNVFADTPYLQGRAFVFASQFITALPESAGADYISQALAAIAHDETSIPVKLSAIRGIVK